MPSNVSIFTFLWPHTSSFWSEKAEIQWEVKVRMISIGHLFPGRLSITSITWHSPLALQCPGTQRSRLGSHSAHFAVHTFTCSVVIKQTRTQARVLCCTFKSWWPRATFTSCLQSSPEEGLRRLLSGKKLEKMSTLILYSASASSLVLFRTLKVKASLA